MTFGTVKEDARASDIQEGHLDPRVLDQHCISWGIGPLKIEACADLSVPNASVSAYLLGMKIGECAIGSGNCCNIGGSVDGFKAVAKICLDANPLKIVIDAELCVPFAPCKKYHTEIPLSAGEDVETQTSLMWGGNGEWD